MDVRRGRENAGNKPGQANLPSIGGGGLPGLAMGGAGGALGQVPTIVLPHSEPLTEA